MAEIDVYSYTKGSNFTSEVFKIEITNLPDWVGFAQFKKRLTSLGLKPVKVKLIDRGKQAFATFRCEEDREKALVKCEGHQWKGLKWKVKKANPAADPLLKKRKQETEEEAEPNRKVARTEEDDLPPTERLNRAVTPLFDKPYEKQLEIKEDELKTYLKRLVRNIQYNNESMWSHLKVQKEKFGGLCCEMEPMKPSPVLSGYRNKCEFTIGKSPEGEEKTVGFRLGRYNKGIVTVLGVSECIHVPDRMKQIIKVIQKYLQEESSYDGYDPENHTGHWRQVMLRLTQSNTILAVLTFHPQQLSQEEIKSEQEKVKDYFQTGSGAICAVTSMYFQLQSDRGTQSAGDVHLFGDQHIYEDLLGMKFRISPAAFFQVNTKAAEVLYTTVGDWCSLGANTVLLDICCGTGTIGLSLAKRVSRVVGVEMCVEAVEDAKYNAKLNGIENAEFHCSKAESFLPNYMRNLRAGSGVAVVDPPRSGLHADVVRAIRKCSLVKRVVYIACNPKGTVQNIVDFTRRESKRVHGEEFCLLKAVGVDLFPHAQQCELVMLLERRSAVKHADKATPEAREAPCLEEEEASTSTDCGEVGRGGAADCSSVKSESKTFEAPTAEDACGTVSEAEPTTSASTISETAACVTPEPTTSHGAPSEVTSSMETNFEATTGLETKREATSEETKMDVTSSQGPTSEAIPSMESKQAVTSSQEPPSEAKTSIETKREATSEETRVDTMSSKEPTSEAITSMESKSEATNTEENTAQSTE